MKAVVMTRPGGPEVLELRELPTPALRDDRDVLVALRAAALNPADVWFRGNGPYVSGGMPCILGHDGAGVVERVGSAVSRFHPGDRVAFCNGGIGADPGTYAEYAVVPEGQLAAIPEPLGFAEAAAAPLVCITAWEALYDRAAIRPGELALIHGGAGGTGHVAVQLAHLHGARVAATVGDGAKAAFVKELGAELPIRYRDEDFVAVAKAWSGGRGLDVALDNVGAETMRRTFAAMAPYGRIATLMGTPGDTDAGTAYVMNLTIHNVMMLTPMWLGLRARLEAQARIVGTCLDLMAKGRLRLRIAEAFPLARAAAAQALLEAGGTTGKIVLTIGA